MNMKRKCGSALIIALWTILILSAIVFSFAFEAKVQSNVNSFMRERARLDRLVENGTVIAEVIIAGAPTVSSESEDESESDLEELEEKDRWLQVKRQLKKGGSVVVGPIAVDAENPDDGIVTIEIKVKGSGSISANTSSGSTSTQQAGASSGGASKFNLNMLYPGEDGDPHYKELWTTILTWANVPEDEIDKGVFIDSWTDWRDKDDVATSTDGGAESLYYEEEFESEKGENPIKPTNGAIPDIRELAYIRGFRDHPAILGVPNKDGVLAYDPEDKSKEPLCVSNILEVLTVDYGSSTKIDIRHASKAVLMCIPGIQKLDEEYDYQETSDIADAIIGYRKALEGEENDYTTYLKKSFDEPDWSWEKLCEITSDAIGSRAKEYITWESAFGEGSIYELTIIGQSRGQSHTAKAVAIVNGEELKYIRWQENP